MLLHAVLRAAGVPRLLVAVLRRVDTGAVERATNDVVADPRQILHTPPTDEDDRVLLEVVPLARDVGGHFHLVRQPDASHLSVRRIRLFRIYDVDADADAALLRAPLERGGLRLSMLLFPSATYELVDGRHDFMFLSVSCAALLGAPYEIFLFSHDG